MTTGKIRPKTDKKGETRQGCLSGYSTRKRIICAETTKVQQFKDMKNVKIECKKNDFSMIQFDQNFHFFWSVIFSNFLDGIGVKVLKHQTK